MYAYRIGDLLDSDEQAIAHGCNCQGVMGAGVARLMAQEYGPKMVDTYKRLCRGDMFSPGSLMAWESENRPLLYNLATQDLPGPYADIEAISSSVYRMLKHAQARGIERIGMPRIGAGIGGLDWGEVDRVIYGLTQDSPIRVTIYILERDLEGLRV